MDLTSRQLTITIILLTITVVLAGGYYYFVRNRVLVNIDESFENGFDSWVKGYDLPQDPNNPGHVVPWNITISDNQSASGDYSVMMYVNGQQDDGTIWIERNITGITGGRYVTVAFSLYSSSQSFNTLAAIVGYVGTAPPRTEQDFQVLGSANEEQGWKDYKTSLEIKDVTGSVWVAVGISVRWEAELVYYIDDVYITVI